MPFEIVRNDITNMQVDAIVNTANPKPIVGWGVDAGVLRGLSVVYYLKKRCRKRLANAQAFSEKHVKKYTV